MTLPVVITGLTTALGFVSLLASGLPSIREFGAFAALGVLVTVVVCLTFTPAALQLLGRRTRPLPEAMLETGEVQRGTLGWTAAAAEWLARFTVQRRGQIGWIGAAVLAVATVGALRIEVGQQHIENFAPESRTRRDYEAVNRAIGGANALLVAIESEGASLTRPPHLRAIAELEEWLVAQPEIGGATSIAGFLAYQNQLLHGDDPEWRRLPDDAGLAEQLLLAGAGDRLDALIDPRRARTLVRARSFESDPAASAALIERVRARLAALPAPLVGRVTGEVVVLNETLDDVARGQLRSLGLAVLTIWGVLAAMFTSLRIGLVALFPNLLPVAIFFGALGFSGTPLSSSTSLIACIALGIAVDDTIHYFARFNRDAKRSADEVSAVATALGAVFRPVSFTTLGICLGFLALSRSELASQVQFGWLAAFTLASAWLVDVTLTPALCSRLRVVTLWDVLSLDLGEEPHLSIPLLEGLSLRQARIVALVLSVETVPPGTRLMSEGEQGREMYVVLDGELRGSVNHDGREIELSRMRRGDTVGEVGLFAGQRTADVDSVEETRLLRLRPPELARLQRRYPRIAARLFSNLSGILATRLVNTTEKLR